MERVNLNGKWNVKSKAKKINIPASVPGSVHTDLMAAGKIDDPFYRDNEQKQFWIGETDWVYSRPFTVGKETLAHDKVLLRCEGLDTLATVKVNGKVVGKANNMFRLWEWDVKKVLKAGKNTIEITFDSAVREGQRLQKINWLRLTGLGHHRIDGSNRIRKEQCNFGWDWGPMCVTCGVWKPISIVAYNTARLDNVFVEQKHGRGKKVSLTTHVEAQVVGRGKLMAGVTISLEGKVVAEVETALSSGKGKLEVDLPKPKLWWPNGMGEQPLYEVTVDLLDKDGLLLDTETTRIGLRTIKLVRKSDRWGESFHFAVNGVPFFAKGANWIPAEQFQSRVNREQYDSLLQSTADANMNMLRVWGGGIYEEDVFYDLCDEKGILIWQDFMFACSAYPAYDKSFMENVRIEAEENVKRLRNHPSIGLYCGNNELEQCGFVNDTGENGAMKWSDYKKLFDKMLPDVVKKYHPEIDYWPSSEHSPRGDRMDTRNPKCGDGHLWNVWHGQQPFEWYRTSFHRFCSEFGFQSFPEPKTVRGYTEPEERNVTSRVMELHQRSGIGNSTIMHYMLSWYRLPVGFDNTLWVSQIQQGLAIKYAVEHWRRNMPQCMGAIYWQLNDCWPVASWSSIDYHGRWKALQYMAKKFFNPLLITGVEDLEKKTVEVWVSSDLRTASPCTVRYTVTTASGKVVDKGTKKIRAPKNGSKKIDRINLGKLVETYTERDLIVWLELVNGRDVVSRNFVTLVRPKHLTLEQPEIQTRVKSNKDGSFLVTLKAKRPAPWAWLELKNTDARMSDNFICLEPKANVEVLVTPAKTMSKAQFEKQLVVKSLIDTYTE